MHPEYISVISETYKNTVMPHGRHIYANTSDMANTTICTYHQYEHAPPHWKCVLRCCAKCPCINLPNQKTKQKRKKQHPQLGFTFITSLDVVLLMVEFHLKTKKYVTCVDKNLYRIHLQKYTPEKN